jgi:hypothetical protein
MTARAAIERLAGRDKAAEKGLLMAISPQAIREPDAANGPGSRNWTNEGQNA